MFRSAQPAAEDCRLGWSIWANALLATTVEPSSQPVIRGRRNTHLSTRASRCWREWINCSRPRQVILLSRRVESDVGRVDRVRIYPWLTVVLWNGFQFQPAPDRASAQAIVIAATPTRMRHYQPPRTCCRNPVSDSSIRKEVHHVPRIRQRTVFSSR